MREVAHGGLHLRHIDGERAVGVDGESALVQEIIELQRHALAVRFGDAEAHGAECGREIRGVELALVGGAIHRHQLVVVEVLQHEEAGDIGLGLFDGAVEFLQFLARRGGASRDLDLVRADAVAEFMRQNVREEVIEAEIFLRARREHARRRSGSGWRRTWLPECSSA